MQEHVLSLNDFAMPKVFDGKEADYILLVRLLLLNPGKFQSHPEMGVGLKSRYRFNNNDNFLSALSADIKSQINTYLPNLMMTDVNLTIKNNVLGIIVDTDEGSYVVSYNGSTNETDVASTALDNLK